MCGIFGALVVDTGAQLNVAILEELAVINEERGPHAFGFASTDGLAVKAWKNAGRPSHLKRHIASEIMDGATAFVGHTRWATHGNPADNRNNHPHEVPHITQAGMVEGVIVHNGQVTRHADLVKAHALEVESECDSEVIAHLYSCATLMNGHGPGPLSTVKRARIVAETIDCPSNFLFLGPTRFAAVKMGRSLWWHKYEGVVYFSSLPLDFGADFARGKVTDNAVRSYNWDKNTQRWKLVGRATIARGLRKGGAARVANELSIDWRKNNGAALARRGQKAPSLTRQQIDRLLDAGDAPTAWKRPEKCGQGIQITYTAGTTMHSLACKCSKCATIPGRFKAQQPPTPPNTPETN